jgi:BirA family biotin operon repressor/biotin-[acetyl-CoA-carboxylase] ligase
VTAAPDDLAPEVLATVLGGRPVRTYGALLSTEADALAWARAGGPHGGVVVAGGQRVARTAAEDSLAFSLLLRPSLCSEREGWIYLVAATAMGDVMAPPARYEWPGTVTSGTAGTAGTAGATGTAVAARVTAQAEVRPEGVEAAVVTVLVPEVRPPRGPLLADIVEAVEARLASPTQEVLAVARARCSTLGRPVRARILPTGTVEGRAADLAPDGSLVIAAKGGRPIAVRPNDLDVLEQDP